MSGNIRSMRDNIAQAMRDLNGEGERFYKMSIHTHGGEFDTQKELERYGKNTPAVILAAIRVDVFQRGGLPYGCVVMGAFCMCQDKPADARDGQILDLVENVADFVQRFPTKDWGVGAGKVQNLIARNLYNEAFDARGVALWGVFWEQEVELLQPVPDEYPDTNVVHVDYDLFPRDNDADLGDVIDADDDITLDEEEAP